MGVKETQQSVSQMSQNVISRLLNGDSKEKFNQHHYQEIIVTFRNLQEETKFERNHRSEFPAGTGKIVSTEKKINQLENKKYEFL